MKRSKKLIIVSSVLIGIGLILFALSFIIGIGQNARGFTAEKYNADKSFNSISIDIGACQLNTEFYDGEFIEIEYQINGIYKANVREREDKLLFDYTNRFPIMFDFGVSAEPEITIKFPQNSKMNIELDIGVGLVNLCGGNFGNIDVDVSAGTFEFNNGVCESFNCNIGAGKVNISNLTTENVDLSVSAGKATINKLTAKTIKCDVSVGDLILDVKGKNEEYTITSRTSAGSCNVFNQKGTTDKTININCSAGSVKVTFGD